MDKITCEKDLEYYYKTLLNLDISSIFGSDGYYHSKETNNCYLFECKHFINITDDGLCRALIQLWFYEQRFIKKTYIIPNVFVVVTDTEYILFYVSDLLKYFNYDFDFSIAPSKAYTYYQDVIDLLKKDIHKLYHIRDSILKISEIFKIPKKEFDIDYNNFYFIKNILSLYEINYVDMKKIIQNKKELIILKNNFSYNEVVITDKIMETTFCNFINDNKFIISDEMLIKTNNVIIFNLGERYDINCDIIDIIIKSENELVVNNKSTKYYFKSHSFNDEIIDVFTNNDIENVSVIINSDDHKYIFKPLINKFFIRLYRKNTKNMININD